MARKAATVVEEKKAEEVAETAAGCPLLVLRADEFSDFLFVIELAHAHPELRQKVREMELWREENGIA
jgi:hypothetical protein